MNAPQEQGHPKFRNRLLETGCTGKGVVMAGGDILHHSAFEIKNWRLQVRFMQLAVAYRAAPETSALDLQFHPFIIGMSYTDRAIAIELARQRAPLEPLRD